MRKIILLLSSFVFMMAAGAQVIPRLENRVKNKLERKAGDKIEEAIDEAVDGKKKPASSTEEATDKQEGSKTNGDKKVDGEKLEAYSKYDFVQGEKIIAYEDFTDTETGDFPARWNTNATAEVVTVKGKEGKWLKINKEGVFYPEFIKDLPENFTLEFDVAVNNEWSASPFVLNIANLKNENEYQDYYHNVSWRGSHAIHLEFMPGDPGRVGGHSRVLAAKDGNYMVNNTVDYKAWDNATRNFAHISLWRQKTRLRVYLNGQKIWDLPRAFDAESKYNSITFAAQSSYHEADYFILGNIRLAVGAPDTRNKLITEGKFVTNGIRFDTNSDKIKPDSYGVLKQIAEVLKENEGVRIKIVGHTDSDGDDKTNLELSKKRAAAVRQVLSSEFSIDESRMETDGAGESKPVTDNKTPETKAQNRRVEFIKM